MFEKFKAFDESYGEIITYCCRILFVLCAYCAIQYLNANYVSKDYFDKTVAIEKAAKESAGSEQKSAFAQINGKLDAILLNNAANDQKLLDLERRVGKVEDKMDRLKNP